MLSLPLLDYYSVKTTPMWYEIYQEILVFDSKITSNSLLNRTELASLPSALSHMQVVVYNNFLYVLGGCTTQCAHGESAVNSVLRYDPRFDTWFQVCPMINKRAYFFAGVLNDRIYTVGGKWSPGFGWISLPPTLTNLSTKLRNCTLVVFSNGCEWGTTW
jgi:hypothetical protein